MPGHVNISSVWKELTGVFVNVAGVWKEVTSGQVNVSGVWKEWHNPVSAATVLFTPGVIHDVRFSTTASATFTVQRNGDLLVTGNISDVPGANDWIDPRSATVGDAWHVRLIKNSGSDPTSGPALATWHALTSDRQWSMVQSIIGGIAGNFTIQFSNDGGSSVFYSKTFDFAADNTAF